jgi:hypothetical protein
MNQYSGLPSQKRDVNPTFYRQLASKKASSRHLDGLHLQKQLENVNFTGCPISEQLSFKMFAVASIAKHIISLNGMPISADDEEGGRSSAEISNSGTPSMCTIIRITVIPICPIVLN